MIVYQPILAPISTKQSPGRRKRCTSSVSNGSQLPVAAICGLIYRSNREWTIIRRLGEGLRVMIVGSAGGDGAGRAPKRIPIRDSSARILLGILDMSWTLPKAATLATQFQSGNGRSRQWV